PCWEGMAARGLGLRHAGRGDRAAADGWLGEATVRCNRTPDRYQWIHGYVLDAAAGEAVAREDAAKARGLAAALGALAARCDMRELVVRSHLHRHRLGDGSALAAARMLGRGIDNPELGRMLA
ncbi:MAG TPA: hypothetical protein VFT95_02540, partial [Micromonosporaceae bacterium]|nr:hypothetical protein [Micromonosporaceae bacterium]